MGRLKGMFNSPSPEYVALHQGGGPKVCLRYRVCCRMCYMVRYICVYHLFM